MIRKYRDWITSIRIFFFCLDCSLGVDREVTLASGTFRIHWIVFLSCLYRRFLPCLTSFRISINEVVHVPILYCYFVLQHLLCTVGCCKSVVSIVVFSDLFSRPQFSFFSLFLCVSFAWGWVSALPILGAHRQAAASRHNSFTLKLTLQLTFLLSLL